MENTLKEKVMLAGNKHAWSENERETASYLAQFFYALAKSEDA